MHYCYYDVLKIMDENTLGNQGKKTVQHKCNTGSLTIEKKMLSNKYKEYPEHMLS